jgi:hypothetical protein
MTGTIYDFCERSHISLKKARRLDKEGWLRLSSEVTPLDEIRLTLRTGARRLSVAQLVYLVDNPSHMLELGKYGKLAEAQVDALDNPTHEIAPKEVAANILEAYKNEPEAVDIVASWVASIIPNKPVNHAYLAVRLLLGVPENIRKYDFAHIQRVFMHCRAHPKLAGCWKTVRQASRNVTFYQKLALDL